MKHSPAPACKKALTDATARWPKRNRASDGIMGDAAHAARKSDHNTGLAFDLTHDPVNGPDCNALAKEVISDPRVTYVIWTGRIYKTRVGKWETYRGVNPHNHHMHVSILESARKKLSPWPWSTEVLSTKSEVPSTKSEAPVVNPVDGAKSGEPTPDVAAQKGEAIVGGRPEDPPKQVTKGSTPTRLAISGGVLSAVGSAVWAYIKNNPNVVVISVICFTILILAFVFRQLILDWARLQLGASPDKYNVR